MMHSIKEMIDAGVSKNAITEFARCIGAEMIFSMTYLMDDPEVVEDNEYVNWGLFITDDEGRPMHPRPRRGEDRLVQRPFAYDRPEFLLAHFI